MSHPGLLVVVGCLGCAHNVPQDRATGPDGKLKGASPVTLDNGAARIRGVVTYPGGDRIDWRQIELPAGKRGRLELQLTWQAPRPGLQVAFDVFDQWNTQVAAASATRKRTLRRRRSATIDDAIGTYFVRIYAPTRGDAGSYVLAASFEHDTGRDPVDPRTLPIPDPPRLAAVPQPTPTCEVFDPHNAGCATACPDDAPVGWRGCKKRDEQQAREAQQAAAAVSRAECLKNQPKPFTARIIHVEVQGDVRQVKLDTGTDDQPLTTGWSARVLATGTESLLANGTVTLRNIGKQQTRGTTALTTDQVNANPWVRLIPPPASCP